MSGTGTGTGGVMDAHALFVCSHAAELNCLAPPRCGEYYYFNYLNRVHALELPQVHKCANLIM